MRSYHSAYVSTRTLLTHMLPTACPIFASWHLRRFGVLALRPRARRHLCTTWRRRCQTCQHRPRHGCNHDYYAGVRRTMARSDGNALWMCYAYKARYPRSPLYFTRRDTSCATFDAFLGETQLRISPSCLTCMKSMLCSARVTSLFVRFVLCDVVAPILYLDPCVPCAAPKVRVHVLPSACQELGKQATRSCGNLASA